MKYMPSNFRPANLVKLHMPGSNLERLWEGVHALRGLKEIDLKESIHLKEIPNLSMATNLEKLDLTKCTSLLELPSSIQSLNKLEKLILADCSNLKTLPNGINLRSLHTLHLLRCPRLNIFPNISTNISELYISETSIDELPSNIHLENLISLGLSHEKYDNRIQLLMPLMVMLPHSLDTLIIWKIPSLVELPSSIQKFTKLRHLIITDCINLETLPTDINLKYLYRLDLRGCSRLKTFPNISTSVREMKLGRTGIEEVPWWIDNFSMLMELVMSGCNNLKSVSLHLSKLKKLEMVDFSDCRALGEASWNNRSSDVAMETDNTNSESPFLDESSSSFPENLINCFNYIQYEHERKTAGSFRFLMLTGEEVLPYFNHSTTGTSLTNIPLFHSTSSPPFFRFKVCAVIDDKYSQYDIHRYEIHVSYRFKNRLGNHIEYHSPTRDLVKFESGIHLVIFECSFPLNEDNASPAEVNYDRVDIKLRLSNLDGQGTSELKGWGIRLSDEFSSPDDSRRTQDVTEGLVVKCSDRETFSVSDRSIGQHLVPEEQLVAEELGSRSISGSKSVDCLEDVFQGILHLMRRVLRRVFGNSPMDWKNMVLSL